jgi:1-acyl-sn-glycerol-3-phosphate acyltransferase
MYWSVRTALGSYLSIMAAIIPVVIISLFSKTGDLPHVIARYWARFSLLCAGCRVVLRGEENIPGGPAVYMPNHVSHFDVFAILGHLNVQFRLDGQRYTHILQKHGFRRMKPGTITSGHREGARISRGTRCGLAHGRGVQVP